MTEQAARQLWNSMIDYIEVCEDKIASSCCGSRDTYESAIKRQKEKYNELVKEFKKTTGFKFG